MSEEVEKAFLDDLRRRIELGPHALPSVAFYTVLNAHRSLNSVSLSPDGALVSCGFSDSSIKVWDMQKLGEERLSLSTSALGDAAHAIDSARSFKTFRGHSGPVFSSDFSPDSRFLLSSSADCTVRLWSMEMESSLVSYKGHGYPTWDAKFSPMGHYFASASYDRTAQVWSVERTQPLRIMAGHLSDVDCVQWHANCNYIATGSADRTVRLWDVAGGECVRIFAGHRGAVLSLALSPDGRFLASADDEGAILLWDLASGRRFSPLLAHTSCVWSLAFSGEGSLLASGSADNTVRLWDVSSATRLASTEEKAASKAPARLRLIKSLPTKSTPVYALQFSRRNLLLAAGAFCPPKR